MKNPHSLTIVCHADSPKALLGTIRETLDEFEEGFDANLMKYSGILTGGGEHSLLQGFYTHPTDYNFSAHLPDSPNLDEVELSEKTGAIVPPMPVEPPCNDANCCSAKAQQDPVEEVRAFVSLIKQMFPNAEISLHEFKPDKE